MRWFKHFNDLLSNPKMQILLDKHGTTGTDGYMRLLEYAAQHFDVNNPGTYLESQRHLLSILFPLCCKKTGKLIIETFQGLGLAKFSFHGKEILFKVPEIIHIGDEYTAKVLKEKKGKCRD